MNIKNHSGLLHILFYLGFSLLACHELDAVARHEWRLLPVLNKLNDDSGLIVFVLLHIPCLLYTSPSPRDGLLSRMPSSA